jgi:uncharacterized DUF497 family protein
MRITFDPAKRAATLDSRGLDFIDASRVFAGRKLEFPDDRQAYGEVRMITVGLLDGRMVVVVWTPRGDCRRIISMRKANDREKARFGQRLGEG